MAAIDSAIVKQTALSDMASLCALLFQVPDARTVDLMKGGSFSDDVSAICVEMGYLEEAKNLKQRAKGFSEALSSQDDSLGWVRREYTRLFAHPKNPIVYPYEGVYLDKTADRRGQRSIGSRMFVNKSALDAEKQYKAAGLEPNGMQVPADSVTMELEFVSVLHARIASVAIGEDGAAYENSMLALRDFLESHVDSWMPSFFGDVKESTDHPLYYLAAELGLLLCSAERAQAVK